MRYAIRTKAGYNFESDKNDYLSILGTDFKIIKKRYSEIKKNDYLIISKFPSQKEVLYPNIDRNIARLIGYFIAEGDFYKTRIGITNSNVEVIQDVQNILNTYFKSCIVTSRKRDNVKHICSTCQKLYAILSQYDMLHKSGFKHLGILKHLPLSYLKELLKGYFEGDGGLEKRSCITCTSKSQKLITEIQQSLLRFGIVSFQRLKELKSGPYKGNIYYRLSIYGSNVNKFQKYIGFISKEKRAELKHICNNNTRATNKDVIPYIKEIISNLQSQIPIRKNGQIQINGKFYSIGKFPLNSSGTCWNRNTLKCVFLYLRNVVQLYETLNEKPEFIQTFQQMLNNEKYFLSENVFYDKVI